jgi:hypothetical protein
MYNAGNAPVRTVEEFKLMFFDRREIESKTEAAAVRVQGRFGSYVRRRAQTSMRRRKGGTSAPGSPPFAKVGTLRKLLFFGYDEATRTTVVGPAGFGKRPGEVPQVHEFGGTLPPGTMGLWTAVARLSPDARIRIIRDAQRAKMRFRDYVRQHRHQYPEIDAVDSKPRRYPARPYMRPALEAELPKFAGLFRATITK